MAKYEQPDYSDKYNTKLTKEQERAFQKMRQVVLLNTGKDILEDRFDYDPRAMMSDIKHQKLDSRGHSSDIGKKPNHPTFSDQSIYSTKEKSGGKWEENSYTPSPYILSESGRLKALARYMARNEPYAQLNIPIPYSNQGVSVPMKQPLPMEYLLNGL